MRMRMLVGALAVVLGLAAQAEVTTKAATARLKQIGFKDTSYLLNAEGTFSDVLSGDYNLEVNDTATGGAIVTLGSQANTYTGGTYVRCGTLVVPGRGRRDGRLRRRPVLLRDRRRGGLRIVESVDALHALRAVAFPEDGSDGEAYPAYLDEPKIFAEHATQFRL